MHFQLGAIGICILGLVLGPMLQARSFTTVLALSIVTLHGRLAELQFISHFGRFVCALYRHMVGHQPWLAVCGLLPVRHGQYQRDGTVGSEEADFKFQ